MRLRSYPPASREATGSTRRRNGSSAPLAGRSSGSRAVRR